MCLFLLNTFYKIFIKLYASLLFFIFGNESNSVYVLEHTEAGNLSWTKASELWFMTFANTFKS